MNVQLQPPGWFEQTFDCAFGHIRAIAGTIGGWLWQADTVTKLLPLLLPFCSLSPGDMGYCSLMTTTQSTARTTAMRASRPNSSTRRRLLATITTMLGTDCAACGRATIVGGSPLDGRTLNLGHIVSDANGGAWDVANLLPICRRCNVFMGDADWTASGAPMLVKPLARGTRLLPDTGDREVHMEAPAWV